jgi:hypothetical protein
MNKIIALIVLVFSVSACYAEKPFLPPLNERGKNIIVSTFVIVGAATGSVPVTLAVSSGVSLIVRLDLKPKKRNNRNSRSGR